MSGVILTVGALALDTIFRFEHLPTTPGKYLPLDTVQVAQGMATAQAATIVRLGGKARLWASIGDDPTGDRIVTDLTAAGIDLSALRRVPGATSGFSSIFIDKAGERIIVPHYDPAIRTRPDVLPDLGDVAVVSVDVRWPDAAEIALHAARDMGIPGILDVEAAPDDVLDRLVPIAVASDCVRARRLRADRRTRSGEGGRHPGQVASRLRRRHRRRARRVSGPAATSRRSRSRPSTRSRPATCSTAPSRSGWPRAGRSRRRSASQRLLPRSSAPASAAGSGHRRANEVEAFLANAARRRPRRHARAPDCRARH